MQLAVLITFFQQKYINILFIFFKLAKKTKEYVFFKNYY